MSEQHSPTHSTTIALHLDLGSGVGEFDCVPVHFGVPLARGAVSASSQAVIFSDGEPVPTQSRAGLCWGDESVRWLSIDALISTRENQSLELRLDPLAQASQIEAVTCGSPSPMPALESDAHTPWAMTVAHPDCSDIVELHTILKSTDGQAIAPLPGGEDSVRTGTVRRDTTRSWTYPGLGGVKCYSDVAVYPGGLVRVELTLHNPQRAEHAQGLWDLGDPGSVRFESFECVLSLPNQRRVFLQPEQNSPWIESSELAVFQASSGGENWSGAAHVNSDDAAKLEFRGYRIIGCGADSVDGLRASPVAVLCGDHDSIAVAVPQFWQNFPKAIEATDTQIKVGMFPGQHTDGYELQGGECKTHVFWIQLAARGPATIQDCAPNSLLGWVETPPVVRAYASAFEVCGLPFPTWGPVLSPEVDTLIAEALEQTPGLYSHRESADEYGWRNFGDIFADHEALHYHGERALVSHYNNQFDLVLGFLVNYVRTGDRRLFELGNDLAKHVADIDIYWTDKDRVEYNGGLFWFTDHYLHAGTSTHRSYTRANKPPGRDYGGGPGAEHNFTTGLLVHYWLTGNKRSRDAVVSLADWAIAMDGPTRWFGPRGTSTMTADPMYHGPGRGAGNSLNAVMDGWVLTGDSRYLDFARVIVRRVINPADDISKLDLLNAEKRWSYTVFLSSLSKYLRLQADEGILDEHYAYGQASLLHYARWMVENERPYFDAIETLEFPTEAWPSQELRKANVFLLAAEHAAGGLRERLNDRGTALARRAWQDLFAFSTRTQARALGIVMTDGLIATSALNWGPAPDPQGRFQFGAPSKFTPLPIRIRRTVKRLIGRG
ncbi:MAG: hypothetical protein ACI9W2_000485 [Gammaproteobacteria bacterium]